MMGVQISLEEARPMIDLTINQVQLEHNIEAARMNGVVIPTFENM